MKINDIISESIDQQNEAAPMGILARAGHTISSKLGSTSSAAALDVGKRANEIFKTFQNWALRSGVDISAVKVKTLQDWMKSQGLPAPLNLGPQTAVYDLRNKDNVQRVFTGASQQAFAKGPATGGQLGQRYGLNAPVQQAPTIDFNKVVQSLANLTPAQKNQLKRML